MLAFLVCLLIPSAVVSDYVYSGSSYAAVNGSCAYPEEATPTGTCPEIDEYSSGATAFDLTDPDNQPPMIYGYALVDRFGGIDQEKMTFAVTIAFTFMWADDRAASQIRNATRSASAQGGKCSKYCSKTSVSTWKGPCCDDMWLPTFNFLQALPKEFVEEDYDIFQEQSPYDGYNYTYYTFSVSGVFGQLFNFNAFPFDSHALALRVECYDCRVNTSDAGAAAFVQIASSTASSRDSSKLDGQQFPPSSGWSVSNPRMLAINVTTSFFSDLKHKDQEKNVNLDEAREAPEAYGCLVLVSVKRETRAFYTLMCIVPPIILVIVGFISFVIPMANFIDRTKALVALMFPTFAVQYTIATLLPKAYIVLSPHYLVFVSIVMLALLICVAAVSYCLLQRRVHYERSVEMATGKAAWQDKRRWLEGESDDSAPVKPGMEEDYESHSCGYFTAKDKREAETKKLTLDEGVRGKYQKKSALPKFRRLGCLPWWQGLAVSGIDGYRQHIAHIWEQAALTFCFLLYCAAVLAIFLKVYVEGDDEYIA